MNKVFLVLVSFTFGCSTYQADSGGARNSVMAGDYNAAAQTLEKKAHEEGKDQLVYLLDHALMLHYAGRYKESNQEFLKADKMSEIKDYTSLSTEAATLVTNDNIKQYKGEDFEKVLINVYLAINYTLLGEYEDARVECRRVNEKLYKYKFEAKKDYEQNQFARYLAALIWEADHNLDAAYVDYKFTRDIFPKYGYIGKDLETSAQVLGRYDDLKKWVKEYGDLDTPSKKTLRDTGEVILIFEQGHGPVKRPHPSTPRLPKFFARGSVTKRVSLEVVNPSGIGLKEIAPPLYSIEEIAIKNLDADYAGLVAKRLAGVVAKEVVADQIRQKNQVLGVLAWVGMHVADQADLRHWSLLPETLQIARLRLKPGTYTLKAVGLMSGLEPSSEEKVFAPIVVKAGQKVFLNWRSLK